MKQKLKPDWCCYLDSARIGSGWRVISVRKYGWKWLFLQDWGTKNNFRMTFAKWERISKRPMKKIKGEWKSLWDEIGPHSGPLWGVKYERPKTKGKSSRKSIKKPRLPSTNKAKQKERQEAV